VCKLNYLHFYSFSFFIKTHATAIVHHTEQLHALLFDLLGQAMEWNQLSTLTNHCSRKEPSGSSCLSGSTLFMLCGEASVAEVTITSAIKTKIFLFNAQVINGKDS
jgi:hypothetical protein